MGKRFDIKNIIIKYYNHSNNNFSISFSFAFVTVDTKDSAENAIQEVNLVFLYIKHISIAKLYGPFKISS